jgi:hypothetical protein
VETANKIPANTSAHKLVKDRVQRWRSIWTKAESIYQKAQDAIQEQDLRGAFTIAVRLLDIENTYWKTTKYQELTGLIEAVRVEGSKLAKARDLIDQGGISNLLAAFKVLEEIKSNSLVYSQAQKLVVKIGRAMMDLANAQLEQQNAQEALSIVRQIPDRAGLQAEVQDFSDLASAREQAWKGTVADLESAILQAKHINPDRPLYSQAQELISRWQLEIKDVNHLEAARQYAASGDLPAAIREARQVPQANPRGDEAQQAVDGWVAEIQTAEDQPILNQAEQLASNGDINSLQAAIDQANRIQPGRALSRKARRRIDEWTAAIQRIQDQPYLDRAQQLAATGDIQGAIDTARQVGSGRALYDEAQTSIRKWRDQIQGEAQMRQAYESASIGTSSMLALAIRYADNVPADSPSRAEADRMINVWSQQILRLAEDQSTSNLEQAIAIANTIPSGTEVYDAAQLRIRAWKEQLVPNAPPEQQQ